MNLAHLKKQIHYNRVMYIAVLHLRHLPHRLIIFIYDHKDIFYVPQKVITHEYINHSTAFTALFCGAAFAQSSDIAHEAHRFVNNASAVSHVNSSTHENLPDRVNKNNTPSFSEMNEHERAIVAHSFMNNSASYAHQKMIEEHKKMLSDSGANSKTSSSSFNELNAGEKAALVHEQVNNAGAEAHQTQARKLRGLYSSR